MPNAKKFTCNSIESNILKIFASCFKIPGFENANLSNKAVALAFTEKLYNVEFNELEKHIEDAEFIKALSLIVNQLYDLDLHSNDKISDNFAGLIERFFNRYFYLAFGIMDEKFELYERYKEFMNHDIYNKACDCIGKLKKYMSPNFRFEVDSLCAKTMLTLIEFYSDVNRLGNLNLAKETLLKFKHSLPSIQQKEMLIHYYYLSACEIACAEKDIVRMRNYLYKALANSHLPSVMVKTQPYYLTNLTALINQHLDQGHYADCLECARLKLTCAEARKAFFEKFLKNKQTNKELTNMAQIRLDQAVKDYEFVNEETEKLYSNIRSIKFKQFSQHAFDINYIQEISESKDGKVRIKFADSNNNNSEQSIGKATINQLLRMLKNKQIAFKFDENGLTLFDVLDINIEFLTSVFSRWIEDDKAFKLRNNPSFNTKDILSSAQILAMRQTGSTSSQALDNEKTIEDLKKGLTATIISNNEQIQSNTICDKPMQPNVLNNNNKRNKRIDFGNGYVFSETGEHNAYKLNGLPKHYIIINQQLFDYINDMDPLMASDLVRTCDRGKYIHGDSEGDKGFVHISQKEAYFTETKNTTERGSKKKNKKSNNNNNNSNNNNVTGFMKIKNCRKDFRINPIGCTIGYICRNIAAKQRAPTYFKCDGSIHKIEPYRSLSGSAHWYQTIPLHRCNW